MLSGSSFKSLIVLAAGALLLCGCRSGPAHSVGADHKPSRSGREIRFDERDRVEAHAHYATALILEMNGDAEGALQEFYQSAVQDIENEALILEVSRALIQAKQMEKALELLSRATSRPGAAGTLFARLGFVYFQLGKTEEAVRANGTAIRRDPRSLIGYQNLFLIQLQQKNNQEALKVLDEAARVSKTGAEFLIGLGELYGNFALRVPSQREIAFSRGNAVLQRALKENPNDPQLRLRLADAFSTVSQNDEAARLYQELLKDLPDMPYLRDGVRAKLTELYLRGRDNQQAAEQLETMIRDNPTDAQAYYWLGTIASGQTNFTRAIDAFSKVVLLNPSLEQPYYDLAIAQINGHQVQNALETLEQARQKFPQRFFGEYLTGLAYGQQEDYTNALKHLTTAEIIAQASIQAQTPVASQLIESLLFQLGAASERIGDYAAAEKHFEKCLEMFPNNHEAQNYLGFMWADRGEKLDQAKALIEKALVAEPENAAYLDSMGWALFKLNQPREALDYLLRAVKNSEEEDAVLYDHLGDVYATLSDSEKALEAWTRSLAVEENEAVRRKLDASKR